MQCTNFSFGALMPLPPAATIELKPSWTCGKHASSISALGSHSARKMLHRNSPTAGTGVLFSRDHWPTEAIWQLEEPWTRQSRSRSRKGKCGGLQASIANQGAAGVDGQSIAEFEADLEDNLYKLWKRQSSGSYFPPRASALHVHRYPLGLVHELVISANPRSTSRAV